MFFGVLAVALVIVLLGALLLPRLINSQRIKDKISSELAKKTEGSFIFERIALLWLPRPAVLIEHAEFFFDDTVHGSVRNDNLSIDCLFAHGSSSAERSNTRRGVLSNLRPAGRQRSAQWLSRSVELPEELKLRSPLRIVAQRFAWRADEDITFRGQVTAAGGPKRHAHGSDEALYTQQRLACSSWNQQG